MMGFLAPVVLAVAGAVGTAATAVGLSYAVGFWTGIALLNVAAVALVGNAIKSLAPDIPSLDQYAGVKLQTTKNNYNPVPVIYGENKTGSNIVFQETNEAISGATNKDYWSIQIIGDGQISNISEMYGDEIQLTQSTSTEYYNTYCGCKVYLTSGYYGMYLHDINFYKSGGTGLISGSSAGLANVLIPPNVSFIAVHQKFDATNHQQLYSLTQVISGKKVRKLITSPFAIGLDPIPAYSNNPVDIIIDILVNYLNVPYENIDFESLWDSRVKCVVYGYECNISFVQQHNIQGAIQSVLSTFRGRMIYSEGKYRLSMDAKDQAPSLVLTEDDVVNNSLSVSMKGFNEIANKITIKYINPNDSWLSAQVSIKDDELIAIDGQEIERRIEVLGCTSTQQAEKLAEITLNSMRYTESNGVRIKQTPLVVSFTTTVKNASLEVGDIISIDHTLFERDRLFTVLSLESDQSGAIKVGAMEYCLTHYQDSSGNDLI